MNPQADMWVAFSDKAPHFDKIIANKQEQKSLDLNSAFLDVSFLMLVFSALKMFNLHLH